jgi:hypothetical protein
MMMRKGNTMNVQLGNIIRGYDFKPMVGRNDCFVEGEVVERNAIAEVGYNAYKIRVTRDVFDGQEQPAGEYSRVGQFAFVPWKVSFMEFDGRIMNLSE